MPTINSVSSGVVNVDRKVPKYIQISEFFVGIKISTMALGEHPQFWQILKRVDVAGRYPLCFCSWPIFESSLIGCTSCS